MKHCVIMTAYHDLPMLRHFVEHIPLDWGIYLHIDRKSSIDESDLPPRVNVCKLKKIYWGAWEHLWCFVHLMTVAQQEGKYDYFHLVSGQDYFATSPEKFDQILGNNGYSYIGLFPIPNPNWGWEGGEKILRYKTFSSYMDIRKTLPRLVNKLYYIVQKLLRITQPLPDWELYGGSVYCSLHSDFVRWITTNKEATTFLEHLRNTTCAEEVYLSTLIMNSPYREKCLSKNLRYDDWSVEPAPKFLDASDYLKIITSGCLFCRKLDYIKSKALLNMLDGD